jgi:ferrous iron transport protein B
MHELAYTRSVEYFSIDYGREIEQEIVIIQKTLDRMPVLHDHFPSRWLALKLLEQDPEITHQVKSYDESEQLFNTVQNSIRHLKSIFGEDVDTIIADRRYGWINGLVKETVQISPGKQTNITDQIDKIVTNRFLGIPIFFAFMWLMFKFTTDVSAPFLDWIKFVIEGPISRWVISLLQALGLAGTWVESLLVHGVLAGVGGVIVFIPVLMALYMMLAILEDSGYMARAAFVMDRFMHALGLHGKSFLPLILGFGCNVPAIYATRTLGNQKDRLATALLSPFMSCGARLPVYVLFASIFFPHKAGLVVFGIYLVGIITAILAGLLAKNTLLKVNKGSYFVLELPPYRLPTLKSIWYHMWEHTSSFVRKAGTLILFCSLVIWVLLSIPVEGQGKFGKTSIEQSAYAFVAKGISPVFNPAGFGTWQNSGALISGLVAKEVIVGSFSQVYNPVGTSSTVQVVHISQDLKQIGTSFLQAAIDTLRSIPGIVGINTSSQTTIQSDNSWTQSIRESFDISSGGFGRSAALAFLVFVLLYTPCIATLAAERQEFGSKWMWFSALGQLMLAWVAATVVFQLGKLLLV